MKPLFTLALLALPAFAAFPNGYTYCKVVTTQHTMVSGTSDLTNYPLTVILIDNDLRTVGNAGLVNNANGYDIGFYPDCSGSGAALKWEMESYSPTTGAIVAHVLRPTLSHTADDTIGMFYGGSFSSFQSTAPAVWDANYKGVWHLSDVASIPDSTGNISVATNHSATNTTGKIDGGSAFVAGSSQYISSGTSGLPVGNAPLTMEAWVYSAGASALQVIDFWGTDGLNTAIYLADGEVSADTFSFSYYGGPLSQVTASPINTWHHLVGVWDGTTGTLYVDGAPGTGSAPGALNIGTTYHNIGRYSGGDYFNGQLDEVRISNTARSAAWILTEYRNQSAPVTYLSAGPRITGDGGGSRVRHTVRGGV